MKSSIVAATLFSALALAGPFKKATVTVWESETKTVWVTALPPKSGFWGPIGHGHNPTSSVVATSVQTTAPTHNVDTHSIAPIPTTTTHSTVSVQSTTVLPTASVQTPAALDYSKLSDYARPILEQHNFHRDNHSVDPLLWDDELAQWSKQIADTCVYQHSNAAGDGKYGQNIGAGALDNEVPALITNGMYNAEINAYPGYGSEPSMSNFHVWGHFSQLVWRETKAVGCYTTKCAHLANVGSNVAPYFTVCNYRPAGNMIGNFTMNVSRPKGEKSVVVPPAN